MTKKIKLNDGNVFTVQPFNYTLLRQNSNHLQKIISQPHHSIHTLALIAYIHPVLLKNIQHIFYQKITKQGYWSIKDCKLQSLLQTLNILCLLPKFDIKYIKMICQPKLQKDSYSHALWANCLWKIHPNFLACKAYEQSVTQQNTIKVRDFISSIIKLKQQIYQQGIIEQSFQGNQQQYHALDIALQKQGILTADYIPTTYKGQFMEVWVDRTVQLNSLCGNLVCKEKFGQFEYIKGPLLYAMDKGILLVFNNFQQVSHELLISLKSLANEGTLSHNQRTSYASAGFKILGLFGSKLATKNKLTIGKIINHFNQPPRQISQILPQITNLQNKAYLYTLFASNQQSLSYLGLTKLWNRIYRLRKQLLEQIQPFSPSLSKPQLQDKLWNSYFTQQFLKQINTQLQQLKGTQSMKQVAYSQSYKQLRIGRVRLRMQQKPLVPIVKTQYALNVLERVALCSELGECPLLVSETGCGKTTLVQYLAQVGGHRLYVYNMSSGTDVADLVGGFKPINCRVLLRELLEYFISKFKEELPQAAKNQKYFAILTNYYHQDKFNVLIESLIQSVPKIIQKIQNNYKQNQGNIDQKSIKYTIHEWEELQKRFMNIFMNLDRIDSNLVFSFIQGNLLKAMRNGDWILIDQINLATNDVLQKIVPLIEGKSLLLYQKGDLHQIQRHKDFRIIGCMNPATDSGKKPLPLNLSDKFTIIHMAQPSVQDIEMMTTQLCPALDCTAISDLYFTIKMVKTLSLRNLTRAINYMNRNKLIYGWPRALYDGLMLGFAQRNLLMPYFNKQIPRLLPNCILMQGFLLEQGPTKQEVTFHLTQSFEQYLSDLVRAIAGTQLPVLLQGPTSAGKTSMVQYVAHSAGHLCMRINNHEHTEIEEYIGNYFPNKNGVLVFREGPLVKAVREGHWLILDQLNLAKTQILQCLNRLLDDNRQLFIPEQQKHIKPHPRFRIFATQNPASYAGRKALSRAFRNRFVTISFQDIKNQDIMAIMQARCPLVHHSQQIFNIVKKTLQQLSVYRQRQRIFEKDGLITIRNLLKWCSRPFLTKDKFIIQGYAILAQKLRNEEEKNYVSKVLLGQIITKKDIVAEYQQKAIPILSEYSAQYKIETNKSFIRMTALTLKAIQNKEAVLLIGETGCGKTTLSQMLATASSRKFFSINCHRHTEASDLLGSLRPCQNGGFQFVNGVVVDAMIQGGLLLIDEINTAEDSVLQRLNQVLQCAKVGVERGEGWETIVAKEGFCIIATMNPSGDYGKKQLSPALRNRFTEIWVEPITHPHHIKEAKRDITTMIDKRINQTNIALLLYQFIVEYNCTIAQKYGLSRKLLTLRDINWVCQFMVQLQRKSNVSALEAYYWSIRILAIQGVNFMMADSMLDGMREQLIHVLTLQTNIIKNENKLIEILSEMRFPLLIRTDLPLQVLGLKTDAKVFMSPQTDLSQLLGQYYPKGDSFQWRDAKLLQKVKEGGTVALMDLNLAQQQVIQGINSLFDYRGSLFIVELNQTIIKHPQFRPLVVIRYDSAPARKGLPHSFLNRFVKIAVKSVSNQVKVDYFTKKYPQLLTNDYLNTVHLLLSSHSVQDIQLAVQLRINQCTHALCKLYSTPAQPSSARDKEIECFVLQLCPLLGICNKQDINTLIIGFTVLTMSHFSLCLTGESRKRKLLVNAMCYLMKKQQVHIMLSTATDAADLLGSYEQCVVEPKNGIEESTRFTYVQSKIVQTLKKEECMLYLEVPNAILLERVQKQLPQVEEQSKQIILGISEITSPLNKIALLHVHDAEDIPDFNPFFPPNYSQLRHWDSILRKQQLMNYLDWKASQENNPIWYTFQNQYNIIQCQQNTNMSAVCKVKETILQYCNAPHSRIEYQNHRLLRVFLSDSPRQLQSSMVYWSKDESWLLPLVNKFQCLYVLDVSGFKKDALRSLLILLSASSANAVLLKQFYAQIERLYEQVRDKLLKSVIVQYSLEEHTTMVIPSEAAGRWQLRGEEVGALWGHCPSTIQSLRGVERVVLNCVRECKIDVKELCRWIQGLKVKDMHSRALVMHTVKNKVQLPCTVFNKDVKEFIQNILQIHIQFGEGDRRKVMELGRSMVKLFGPNQDMSINMEYYVQQEEDIKCKEKNLKVAQEMIAAWSTLAQDKYHGYESMRYKQEQKKALLLCDRVRELRRKIVYRGSDNVNELLQLYTNLIRVNKQLEKEEGLRDTIRNILRQTQQWYFPNNDILLPYYVGLLLIYQNCVQPSEQPLTLPLLSCLPDPIEILRRMGEMSDFQDRTKDYLLAQKKLKGIIIDEYTQEGIERRKLLQSQQFQQLLGCGRVDTPYWQTHLLLSGDGSQYRRYLLERMVSKSTTYEEWVISTHLCNDTDINIYVESSAAVVSMLTKCIPSMMQQMRMLQNSEQIITLCGKIYELSLSTPLYQLLTDCQQLIDKCIATNSILPRSMHIAVDGLTSACLTVRKMELKKWLTMLDLKVRRTQIADLPQYVSALKQIEAQSTAQGLFATCDAFIRQSKLSCFRVRMEVLRRVRQCSPLIIDRVVGFYAYVQQYLVEKEVQLQKEKVEEMKEYVELAGWKSNEYLIFKATCQKFRRKLHHVLKRYEEALSMSVGQFHTSIQATQIHSSIKELEDALLKHTQQDKGQTLETIDYKELINRIFSAIEEIKSQHHTTQSRMLIIRSYVSQLQEMFAECREHTPAIPLYREIFQSDVSFNRGCKYYYGTWDRLCQRQDQQWNRQLVSRIWAVVFKIWGQVNALCTTVPPPQTPILPPFHLIYNNASEYNPIQGIAPNNHILLEQERVRVRQYMGKQQRRRKQRIENNEYKVPERVLQLMRVNYVLSSVALNLQKKGLCTKEEEEGSGTEEIADGVGIGQGAIHDGAKNVGDQIEFEEQVQGHKDEEENYSNQGQKDENDIQMEGEFAGEMRDCDEEDASFDQNMGQVGSAAEDMKNQPGEGEGSQIDVQIQGQKGGEEELVDNQREEKEERRAQNRQANEEEQRSDWSDQQGGQINEQKENIKDNSEHQENNQDNNVEEKKQEKQIDQGKGQDDKQIQEEQIGNEMQQNDQEQKMQEQEQQGDEGKQERQQQGEQMQIQDGAQLEQNEERKEQRRQKYSASYGRRNMQKGDELKQGVENEAEGQQGTGQNNPGQQGSGQSNYALNPILMHQIQQQKAENDRIASRQLGAVENNQQNQSDSEGNQCELDDERDSLAALPAEGGKKDQIKQEKQQQNQRKQQKRKEIEQKTKQEHTNQNKNQPVEQLHQIKNQQDNRRNSPMQIQEYEKNKKKFNQNAIKQNKQYQMQQELQQYPKKEQKFIVQITSEQTNEKMLNQAQQSSRILQQQLKSVLQPLQAAQYRGDFKTGKKLNLRKIIPYIASQYRKDRIWLRRTEPSQRKYRVLLGLDDTKSMQYGGVGRQALHNLLALSLALQRLHIPTCICAIASTAPPLKPFNTPLDARALTRAFHFHYESPNSHESAIPSFLTTSFQAFTQKEEGERQLCFIISDGKMNKDIVAPYLREARRKDITYVFIVVDTVEASVLNIKTVKKIDGKIVIQQYMADFPFEYFLIVSDPKELGQIFAFALMQFIQLK